MNWEDCWAALRKRNDISAGPAAPSLFTDLPAQPSGRRQGLRGRSLERPALRKAISNGTFAVRRKQAVNQSHEEETVLSALGKGWHPPFGVVRVRRLVVMVEEEGLG